MLILPFQPSAPNYRVGVTIDGVDYLLDVRWNTREGAWYFDMLDAQEAPILSGVKVVLGIHLGRRSTHPFFATRVIVAMDTTHSGREAGLDDLGARVRVLSFDDEEIMLGRVMRSMQL